MNALVNPDIYTPLKGTVIHVRELGDEEKLFRITLPDGIELQQAPLTFVGATKALTAGDAAISVTSTWVRDRGFFDLAIRRIKGGAVTPLMHTLKAGDPVYIRGPFGNGFPVEDFVGKDLILVGGGTGIFPMQPVAELVRHRRKDFGRVAILYGNPHGEKGNFFPERFAAWERDATISYHTGRMRAMLTDLPNIVEFNPANVGAVIVGPPDMYRPTVNRLNEIGIPDVSIGISVERNMCCMTGHCGLCQMGPYRVCVDGPFFWANTVRALLFEGDL